MPRLMRRVSGQSAVIVWLIAMALGLMPVPTTSQSKVPLPDDIRIVPPGPEVPPSPSQPPRVTETDVTPQSRPMTFSRLLDEYLATLQERLKHETASIQESGLAEVKLTVRKDGSITFCEIVMLDGPAGLRNELLPLVYQLGPLPPPPVDADMLDVSMLLPLGYPGPDLLDSIDQEP